MKYILSHCVYFYLKCMHLSISEARDIKTGSLNPNAMMSLMKNLIYFISFKNRKP